MRWTGIMLALSWAASSTLAAPTPDPCSIPNAALIQLTEPQLNRLLRDAFHDESASVLSGTRARAGRSVFDLSYEADLSDPVLDLHDGGEATLSLDVLRADVRIGRIEKKILRRKTICEGAGLRIDEEGPLGVKLRLRFDIEHGGLQVVPQEVELSNAEGLQLVKPSHCTNAPLPTWFLWWVGKGRLRHQVDRLDDVILAKAQAGASRIESRGGLLGRSWEILAGRASTDTESLRLLPSAVDTSRGSLLVTLAASDGGAAPAATEPDWVAGYSDQSFLALSEPLVNEVVRRALVSRQERARRPSGDLSKLFRSTAVYSLAPGLRELEAPEQLALAFRLTSPPEIRFATLAPGARDDTNVPPAVIRVGLAGIEVDLVDLSDDEPRVVGTLVVSARVAVLPYANVLGGLSLEPIENEWSVSSRGIEFDDELLRATIQELVFGELFETRYEPLAQDTRLGTTPLSPRFFTHQGQHLIIALSGS